MALLTLGSMITAGGVVWKYHRVPLRLWYWYRSAPVEPATRQEWTQASLASKDHVWVVQGVNDEGIHVTQKLDEDSEDTPEDLDLSWEEWTQWSAKVRLYCSDSQTSLEDQYWGGASEDD